MHKVGAMMHDGLEGKGLRKTIVQVFPNFPQTARGNLCVLCGEEIETNKAKWLSIANLKSPDPREKSLI